MGRTFPDCVQCGEPAHYIVLAQRMLGNEYQGDEDIPMCAEHVREILDDEGDDEDDE